MRFDLPLFLKLNEEYRNKPLVTNAPQYGAASLQDRAAKRAAKIDKIFPLKGKRVLEIGCGRGETSRAIAEIYNCEVVGVDVSTYAEWDIKHPKVTLLKADISQQDASHLGTFDAIMSFAVFEHVRHPHAMLQTAYKVLRSGGDFYLSANLYRGPKASHRYREVYFPWPHLLFPDEVFHDFYDHLNAASNTDAQGQQTNQGPRKGPAWINQLSIADYFNYFSLIGFKVQSVDYSKTKIDEEFYSRFSEKLSRIPRYDLERDFLNVHLRKVGNPVEAGRRTWFGWLSSNE